MKIAIYHPWPRSAEAEVAKRYVIAGNNLSGVEIRETHTADDVNRFQPDFVLSLAVYSPKAFKFPCYHIPNQPFEYYHAEQVDEIYGDSVLIRGLLSHDGYLTLSKKIAHCLSDLCFGAGKTFTCETGYFNTVQKTKFIEPNFSSPKAAYCGTNWDQPYSGYRFGEIFEELIRDKTPIKFFGPEKAWQHVPKKFYGGKVPFDGESIFESYRKCGIGLALNKKDFFDYDLPTSRIFEIVASGALCISDRLPFVVDNFGDSVLYVDNNNPEIAAEEIREHIEWVTNNPEKALVKAREAHRIFNEKFALENMILRAIEFHKKTVEKQYFTKPYEFKREVKKPLVSIIMRAGGRGKDVVRRSINSIATQSYDNIELLLVLYKENTEVRELAAEFKGKFTNIKILEAFENKGMRSTPMWVGMQNASGEYFGFLDDDDEYYPNHISTLLRSFENPGFKSNVGLVYGGSLDHRKDALYTPEERKKIDAQRGVKDILVHDNNPSSVRLERFGQMNERLFLCDRYTLASNSWLAKTSLLDDNILQDPLLRTAEDYYILLCLKQKCNFHFSYELTNQYNHCFYATDQSVNDMAENEIEESRKRIFERLRTAPYKFSYHGRPAVCFNNSTNAGDGGSSLQYSFHEQTAWKDSIHKMKKQVRKLINRQSIIIGLEAALLLLVTFLLFKHSL